MRNDIREYDLLTSFRKPKIINIREAAGACYEDESGKRYIDFNEMCQVLGQKNIAYMQAMTRAVSGITTNKVGFGTAKAELYEHFVQTSGDAFKAIHLTTSGSEAAEWAVRLAKHITGRSEVISFWNSIHGRTYLSASMSGLPKRKVGHGAAAPGVVPVPYPRCCVCPAEHECSKEHYPCLDYAKKQYFYGSAQDAAAVIVEPYQGARIDIAPVGYMQALYKWAKEQGMLFIMDETQSGMGRSGRFYAYQELDIVPDILLLGKGLGNGMHISALLMREPPAADALPALSGGAGDETLACVSANQVFLQLEDGLLEHIRSMGRLLSDGLTPMTRYESVLDVRCIGLAAAVEFKRDEVCGRVHAELSAKGFLTGRADSCIILKPPYVITHTQIGEFVSSLQAAIERAQLG